MGAVQAFKCAVAAQDIVPKGTVTFQKSEVSTTSSFAVSVLLAGWNVYLIGPGDAQIGLNFIVVLMD